MSSAASPPNFLFSVPVPHALRAPLALCSPLILHWTVRMDFAILSQLKLKRRQRPWYCHRRERYPKRAEFALLRALQFGGYMKSGGFLLERSLALLTTRTLATSMAARQGPIAMAAHQIYLQLRWPPRITLGRLLPHARGLGFKPRRGVFPSGAKKEWGLSPKAKVRVLHTAQLDVTTANQERALVVSASGFE
uniref:Protein DETOXIFICATION 45, chloroplastic n=1 Tax=Tanacetum cinerariifolium TaxID=118510 RepID=A0A699H914_TANCI|nr:protein DETOXIFICATION 45, chloroplastic [Tanacetum cinerariifolium]